MENSKNFFLWGPGERILNYFFFDISGGYGSDGK
jgi:hypothetical protein